MSERKVLNHYYSPDYDPSKIPRVKKKTDQKDVRIMAPFNMKCNTCGNYIGSATKFNAKKETVKGESYHNLLIFRFYIKCPRCMAVIIFRTNPKDQCYEVEHGATENFMAQRLAVRQAKEEAEAEEEEEKINPMKQLENRTKASRQQMEASEQLQQLKQIKSSFHTVDLDSLIENKHKESLEEASVAAKPEDDAIRLEAKELMRRKALDSGGPSTSSSSLILSRINAKSSISSSISKMKMNSGLSSLRKKIKVIPKEAKDEKE